MMDRTIWTVLLLLFVMGGTCAAASRDCPEYLGGIPQNYGGEIAVAGTTVYAGFGPMLVILDTATASAPVVLGTFPLPSWITGIALSGSNVLVAADGLYLLDVSDPSRPRLRGTYGAHSSLGAVAVHGSIACALASGTADAADLQVLDLSDPGRPTLIGSAEVPFPATYLTMEAGRVFVSSRTRLSIFDVGDPAHPLLAGSLDGARGGPMAAQGNLLYVSGPAGAGLEAWEVSDPADPHLLGSFAPLHDMRDLFPRGSHLFVAAGLDGVLILDISDPASMRETAAFVLYSGAGRLALAGDRLYSNCVGLRILDVADPAHPLGIGAWNSGLMSMGGAGVSGEFAYWSDWTTGDLFTARVIPSSYEILSSLPAGLAPILIADQRLYGLYYTSEGTGLATYALADPARPQEMARGMLEMEGRYPTRMLVRNSKAFLMDQNAYASGENVWILDLGDPAHPRTLASYLFDARLSDFALEGDRLYVMGQWVVQNNPEVWQAGLWILDVSDPAAPFQEGAYVFPAGWHADTVRVSDGFVYTTRHRQSGAGWDLALDVLQAGTPTAIVPLGHLEGSSLALGEMALYGRMAFLSLDDRCAVVDLSDPTTPLVVGTFNGCDTFSSISGSTLLEAGIGLRLYDLSKCGPSTHSRPVSRPE